jgi:hypothetical protein
MPSTHALRPTGSELRDDSALGRSDGHQRGEIMSATGENRWPPLGRNRWPLTRRLLFVQLDSERRLDRAASDRWFRRGAAVLTCAPAVRPVGASAAPRRRRSQPRAKASACRIARRWRSNARLPAGGVSEEARTLLGHLDEARVPLGMAVVRLSVIRQDLAARLRMWGGCLSRRGGWLLGACTALSTAIRTQTA